MRHLFLDTNVLIDFLSDRKPFSTAAAQLFESRIKGTTALYISTVSYNNIYYVLRQLMTHGEVIKLLKELTALTQVLAVTKEVIEEALKSEFKDFEDAIQNYTALSNKKIEAIVTRDSKDFKRSSMPILSPLEASKFVELKK